MIRRLLAPTAAFLVCMLVATTAHAAATAADPLFDMVRAMYLAITGRDYVSLAITGLALITALLVRFGAKLSPWFDRGYGRAVILILTGFSGALLTAQAAGVAITWTLVRSIALRVLEAAGGYGLAKALIIEPLRPWMERSAPRWLRVIFHGVSWIFDKLTPPAPAPLMASRRAPTET